MMSTNYLYKLSGLALAAALFCMNAAQAVPLFTQCPSVGLAAGCAVLYTFNPDGSVSTQVDTTIASTDGIEDTLAGVLNLSGHVINFITLSGIGINNIPLFSFDGDGQSPFGSGPGATYSGQYFNAGNILLGITTFSAISPDQKTGTINFPNLTNGGHAWFVLEDQISFTAPPTVGRIPEPTALTLLSIGLITLGVVYRHKRKIG